MVVRLVSVSFLFGLLVLGLFLAGLLGGVGLVVEVQAHQAQQRGHEAQAQQGEDVVHQPLPLRLLAQGHHLHLEHQRRVTWEGTAAGQRLRERESVCERE